MICRTTSCTGCRILGASARESSHTVLIDAVPCFTFLVFIFLSFFHIGKAMQRFVIFFLLLDSDYTPLLF